MGGADPAAVDWTSRESIAFCLGACEHFTPGGNPGESPGEKVRHAQLSPWRSKTLPVRNGVLDILAGFDGPMSVRQVYYQLVTREVVANGVKGYNQVQRVVLRMRRLGEVPWNRIVDRSRVKLQRPGWDGIAQIMTRAAEQYRRSLWTTQPVVPMIACEKHALEGVFADACDIYGASLWVLGGGSSQSFLYDWAEEIRELNAQGKRVAIAYFGDHDPAGLDIGRACEAGLRAHGADDFTFQWLGLRFGDIERFGVPRLPVKELETRRKKYLERFGDVAAELDALPPAELRSRILGFIEGHADMAEIERMRAVEAAERQTLAHVVNAWATNGNPGAASSGTETA